MQQNYSQRLQMQIPQESTYTGLEVMQNSNSELEIISKNYIIRKREELIEYLRKNTELVPYLKSITPIVNDYFPNNEKYLTYNIDPEFEDLNRAQICVIGTDSLFEKERKQMQNLKKDILHLNEYPVEVKSLISVRLWWL